MTKYHVTFAYTTTNAMTDTQIEAETPGDAQAAALTKIAAALGYTQDEALSMLAFVSALPLTKQGRIA
jgi:hypothetical protein